MSKEIVVYKQNRPELQIAIEEEKQKEENQTALINEALNIANNNEHLKLRIYEPPIIKSNIVNKRPTINPVIKKRLKDSTVYKYKKKNFNKKEMSANIVTKAFKNYVVNYLKLKQEVEEELLTEYAEFIKDTKVKVSTTLSKPLQYFIDQYNNSIKNNKGSKTIATYKTNVTKAYKNIINKGVELLNTNNCLDNFVLHDKIDEYIADHNKLYVRGSKFVLNLNTETNKYEFVVGEVSDDPKFKTYLQISVADQMVDNYWASKNPDNPEIRNPTILTTSEDYDDVINESINSINNNKNNMFDDPIIKDSETFRPYKEFSESFSKKDNNYINKTNSYVYMDTIVNVNNNKIYDTEEKKEKSYTSPGKTFEYDQSGTNNINKAEVLFGKRNVVEVTDQIVNNVFTSKTNQPSNIGLQFCIDNVSRTGKFFSEAKYYTSINYTRWYNLNIELKKMYYDEVTIQIENMFEYIKDENNKRKKNLLLEDINTYTNVLSNKELFNQDFYQNRPYMGIGISMNKFSPIVYSDGFLDNLPEELNRSEYERAITLQKQKFTPLMTDKKITKIIYKEGNKEIQEYFNDNFNRQIGVSERTPFDYYFTIAFNNLIGVWNFSNDINIKNNNPLESYKLGHAFDKQKNKGKNAVVLPIEVIIPKA